MKNPYIELGIARFSFPKQIKLNNQAQLVTAHLETCQRTLYATKPNIQTMHHQVEISLNCLPYICNVWSLQSMGPIGHDPRPKNSQPLYLLSTFQRCTHWNQKIMNYYIEHHTFSWHFDSGWMEMTLEAPDKPLPQHATTFLRHLAWCWSTRSQRSWIWFQVKKYK